MLNKNRVIVFMFIISTTFMSCKLENNLLVRVIGKHYQKRWFFSSVSGNENATIPFEIINGWIVIKVKLNKQDIEHKFMFDTGAITKIEPDISEALSLPKLRNFTTTDLNGVKSPAFLINLKSIEIGERTFSDVGAVSSNTELFKCYGIKGIVGYNIMRDAIFKINNVSQTITITQSKYSFNKKDFYTIKITKDWRRIMYLTLKINSMKTKAVLDTGSSNAINLNESVEKELDKKYLIKRKALIKNASNSSVLDTVSFFKPHDFKLDNFELDKNVFILSKTRNVIGNDFLSGFAEVILDSKKNRLYLSKSQIGKKQQGKISNFTLGWSDGIVMITGLAIDSELEKMGLMIGDQVTSINGLATSSFQNICSFKKFDSSMDIYETNMNLTILRNGQEFEYAIDKSLMYE